MLDLWKSGNKKELKIGRKIKALRKIEKKDSLNSNISKLSNTIILPLKRLKMPIKKLMMVSINLSRL